MCFKTRKTPACIVTLGSILVLIGGIILLIEACVFYAKKSVVNTDLGTNLTGAANLFRMGVAGAMLAASILAILLGGCGTACLCKFCKKHSCCLSVFWGLLLTVSWVIFIVVGALLCNFTSAIPRSIATRCETGALPENTTRLDIAMFTVPILNIDNVMT